MTEGKEHLLDYDLDERQELTTLAQVRAIADPLRDSLLELLLERAATVSELATALDRPKGTIAYHVKVLREIGIVKVVRSRRVRAVTENYYGRTARLQYVGAIRAIDESGEPICHNYLVAAAQESAPAHADDTLSAILRHARVPADRMREFRQRIFDLADEFSRLPRESGRGGDQTYAFVAGLYPTEHPHLPEPDSEPNG